MVGLGGVGHGRQESEVLIIGDVGLEWGVPLYK